MGWFSGARPARAGQVLTATPEPVATQAVVTRKGPVVGLRPAAGAALHFRGIPFAASTAGGNRFLPPQPRAPWGPEPLECFRFGPACHQDPKKSVGGLLGATEDEDLGALGDDSLHVNVVVPAEVADTLLPVLVWVHGGSNSNGSNAQLGQLYPSEAFAKRGVVCVSLNYRLALHGFLHLPQQGVTNLALRDILAALEWVRDEIEAFGGDPNNITVWGQSAGAINLASLLRSPRAVGVFHKAVLMSGGPGQWASVEEYTDTALRDFTAALQKQAPNLRLHPSGEPLLEDLQTLPASDISLAARHIKDSMEAVHGVATLPASFNALPDGDVVPFSPSPLEAIRSGAAQSVPLLIGSNANEMTDFARFIGGALLGQTVGRALMGFAVRHRLFLPPEPALRRVAGRRRRDELPDAEAKAACNRLIQELNGDVEAVVNLLATTEERELAMAQATHTPVYEFELHLTAEESPRCGSGHGVDFALCFQADDPWFSAEQRATACTDFFGTPSLLPEVAVVAEGLRDAIVNFATTGSPGPFCGVDWPLGGELVMGTHPHFEAWPGDGVNPKRRLVREIVEGLA